VVLPFQSDEAQYRGGVATMNLTRFESDQSFPLVRKLNYRPYELLHFYAIYFSEFLSGE
jgi:hypothetical protein